MRCIRLAAAGLLASTLLACTSADSNVGSSAAARTTVTADTVDQTFPATNVADTVPADGAVVAVVVEVIDGDTFDAVVDGTTERVRLIGVDAPESGECTGSDARTALKGLLGATVSLIGDTSNRDQYGRLLRYADSDGVFVNQELVRRGMAISRGYPPDVSRQPALEISQDEARAAQRGLWDPAACGPATGSSLAITAIVADPPGPDGDDPNGEYVELTNQGDGDLDLTGWIVRDESASHRFGFPDHFVLGSGATVRLHTGCGAPTAADLYWCNVGSSVWNNDGDTVFVLDPNGNIVVSQRYEG